MAQAEGELSGELTVALSGGAEQRCALRAHCTSVDVRLEVKCLELPVTYIHLTSQKIVRIINHSSILVHFNWKSEATEAEEQRKRDALHAALDAKHASDVLDPSAALALIEQAEHDQHNAANGELNTRESSTASASGVSGSGSGSGSGSASSSHSRSASASVSATASAPDSPREEAQDSVGFSVSWALCVCSPSLSVS